MFEELRNIMDEKGVSEYDLAKMLGVSHSTVWRWMHGKAKISLDMYERAIKELGYGVQFYRVAKKRV